MTAPDSPWTPARLSTLDAVVEHLLPADADAAADPDSGVGGGATEAGVVDSIVANLETPFFAGQAPFVHAALDELGERAAAVDPAADGFAALDPAAREALLRGLETSDNAYLAHAVVLVLQLALEGYLGEPARGGNRGAVGWRRLGLGADGPRRRLIRDEAV
ncbi:MAG: gluconate 2-dehydrogenase subunit 3 family protein [Acidobacteriota bacterium]